MNVEPAYLVMVTSANNNKYYKMIPNGNSFKVEYGRIGATCQTASYPISEWNKKYNEKIKKGYVDKTELIKDLIEEKKPTDKDNFKEIENKAIKEIVDKLQDMANKSIQKNYRVGANQVTQAMVDKAQEQIDNLVVLSANPKLTVKKFNDELIKIFETIPRKMRNVNDYLVIKKDEFSDVIKREQDLLDVMRGQVVQISKKTTKKKKKTNSDETILNSLGLQFEEVSEKEISHIKALLGTSKDKFKRAWKVTNLKTQEAFDNYIKTEKVKEIKELWHGSKNENWWSIINTGLSLRPACGIANGHMFGSGLYFAPKAQKSVGYTSLTGSYWAKGTSNTAYMAVMKVAYGKPFNVYQFDSKYYNFNYKSLKKSDPKANCLHAHAGASLRNDEIIIYQEQQCTIEYLVEIC